MHNYTSCAYISLDPVNNINLTKSCWEYELLLIYAFNVFHRVRRKSFVIKRWNKLDPPIFLNLTTIKAFKKSFFLILVIKKGSFLHSKVKDLVSKAGLPLEGCKGSNWPLNFWERLNWTHEFWKICDSLTPIWEIHDTLTPQIQSIAEALQINPFFKMPKNDSFLSEWNF